jgi:anti-anti-sigma factor
MSTEQISILAYCRSGETSLPAPEPLLSLELTTNGSVTLIKIGGELDMSTAALFNDMVEAVVCRRPARVVVDMADVTFLCATGLGGLIQARQTIAAGGGLLVLRTPSRPTRRLLTLTGTDGLFPLEAEPLPRPGSGQDEQRQDPRRQRRSIDR